MFKLDDRGFTLIELIVVIAILGMLASLTIPNVVKIQEKARIQVDQSNAAILKSAANMAIAEEGLPSSKITWNSSSFTAGSSSKSFNPQEYLEEWPNKLIKNKEEYQVTIDTDGKIEVFSKADNQGDNNEVGQ